MIKPKLLIATSTYPRWQGDPEPGFVHELARRLTDHFDVVVLCPHAAGALSQERLDGVEVLRYRYAPDCWESLVNNGGIVENLKKNVWKWLLLPSFFLAQFLALWRIRRHFCPDVIHAHWLIPQGLLVALTDLLMRRIPYVATSHGADLYALRAAPFEVLKRWVVRRAAAVTVVSGPMLEELLRLGANTQKIQVISMGVDLSTQFIPDPSQPRSDHELLFVGRLVEKKGLCQLIAAMPAVLSQCPLTSLTVVGRGPEEMPARNLARELGLDGKIHFVGAMPQSDLPALYRRAAVMVAPFVRARSGDQEGLGLVVAEALGCGCPVIVGQVDAMREYGLPTVDAENPQALAAALTEMLLETREFRQQRQQEQRQHCLNLLEWHGVTERYRTLLLQCAGRTT